MPMQSRKLRFSTAHPTATLKLNTAHEFAHKHAISVFQSNAVYSMVPKAPVRHCVFRLHVQMEQ